MARGPDPDVTPEEILRFMVEHPDPGFSATEVAEEFEKTRQWADHRLKKMEARGLVNVKKGGKRSKWYWPDPKGKLLLQESRSDQDSSSDTQ